MTTQHFAASVYVLGGMIISGFYRCGGNLYDRIFRKKGIAHVHVIQNHDGRFGIAPVFYCVGNAEFVYVLAAGNGTL